MTRADLLYTYDDYCTWDPRELATHLVQHEDAYIKLYNDYVELANKYKALLQK